MIPEDPEIILIDRINLWERILKKLKLLLSVLNRGINYWSFRIQNQVTAHFK